MEHVRLTVLQEMLPVGSFHSRTFLEDGFILPVNFALSKQSREASIN
jgi:hypothetical protein